MHRQTPIHLTLEVIHVGQRLIDSFQHEAALPPPLGAPVGRIVLHAPAKA